MSSRRETLPSNAVAHREPLPGSRKVYVANEDGDLYVVRAGKAFQVDATNSFNETIFATPAPDGNLLIVRARGHLIALGAP